MNTTTSMRPKEKLSWWLQVKNSRGYLPLLSLSSILFFWLAWPVHQLAPLLFLVFVPLLMMEQMFLPGSQPKAGRRLFLWWYITLLGWNLSTTWWVSNSTLIGGIAANLANAALMCIPLFLFRYTKKRAGNSLGYLSFVLYWITFEHIHLSWDLSWPWLTLGNGFAMFPEWVQWYSATGVFGGSVWVLLVNLGLFLALFYQEAIFKGHIRWATLVYSFLLMVLPIGLGYWLYANYIEKGKAHEIVILQPNIDPYTEKFVGTENFIPFEQQLQRFIQMSRPALSRQTDYLLWPETALDKAFDESSLHAEPMAREIIKFKNQYPELALLTGMTSYSRYPERQTPTARFREDLGYYDVFNTAWFLGDDQNDSTYHKSKLVPGVEILPYPSVTRVLSETIFNLGGTSGGFGRQEARTVFDDTENVGIAPSICYESVYGDYMAKFIRNGAEYIFIITNDGWWGNTAGHKQHFQYARLRAIETRRAIARCANTGISAFINQRGDILQQTEYWVPAVIKGSIKANDELTFYARYGDYLGRTAGWISAFLLVAAFVRKRVLVES